MEMKLVVKNGAGETVTLRIDKEETFIDLKKRVEQEAGISLELKEITSNGKNVIETQRVSEYFGSDHMVVDVTEKPLSTGAVCCVPGCENNKSTHPNKVFFELPQEELRCHQWILYCQRLAMITTKQRLNLSPQSTVCCDHFRLDQFVKNTTTLLKRTAVPCINPALPPIESVKLSTSLNHGTGAAKGVISCSGNCHSARPSSTTTATLCRLCANQVSDGVHIYGPVGMQMQLGAKINASLPMRVDMTDHLPKQVCRNCIQSLEEQCHFVRVVTDTDDFLKELVSRSPNGPPPVGLDENYTDDPAQLKADILYSNELSCPFCYGSFNYITLLKQETEIEIEPEVSSSVSPEFVPSINTEFHCESCSKDIIGFSQLVNHCLDHFTNDVYECVLCQSTHMTEDSLVSHLIAHITEPNDFSEIQMELMKACEECTSSKNTYHKEPIVGEESNCSTSETSCGHFCHPCGKTFPDEAKYQKHNLQMHSPLRVNTCEECGKSFSNLSSLRYHQRCHQSEKPYSCEWCGKSFIRKSMLKNHVTSSHRVPQECPCFTCKICDEAFPSTGLVLAHLKYHHKVDQGITFAEASRNFHIVSVSRLFICDYCERHYADADTMNKHREKHVGDTPYSCKFCSACFPSYSDLSEHKLTHEDGDIPEEYHGETTLPAAYLCEYCDRCLLSYIKYTEHLTIHYGPEPYQCRHCSLKFATLADVTQHRHIHGTREPFSEFDFNRPFECHYCSKSFAIEDALVKHIRMHTGEKPFICDQCGKGFSQSSGLNTHKKVHSDFRPYSCPLCPRTFKIKGDRDVHIRKHSGQRPYKCEYCGKAFMTQHVYSQHRKIHTGERPYRCDVCNVAFRRSHVLTVHKRIHTGEKPNICDVCGKRYRQKGDMLKHRRAQHSYVKIDTDMTLNTETFIPFA